VSAENSLQHIKLTERDHYAILTINRPEQMNSLTRAMMVEISAQLLRLRLLPHIRTIIITGAGNVFCAGASLEEVAQLTPITALDYSRCGQAVMNLLNAQAKSSAVTVAAIDGYCLGGGLDLALACDRRIATARSSFAHPGAKRGIITGWGGTARLPRLIGRAEALRLLATGERIEATQALRLGLLDEVCDHALARACELAEKQR
jgi:enoyl-CoA hydratase